jgi:predicted O-methyltransferase YrrM
VTVPGDALNRSTRFVVVPNTRPDVVEILTMAREARGFMPTDEGELLYRRAKEQLPFGPALEVGTYCGKSALYLGAAALETNGPVFTVDHHRGSEENQAGWEHHDPDTVDPEFGLMDTLGLFRKNVARAGLEEQIVAVVGHSATVARWWRTPLSLLFIDGGHGVEPARNDYLGWTPWVAPDGLLVIHDVFPDPADGGRPPYEEIYLPALASGDFVEIEALGSMRVLQRVNAGA